MREIRTLMFLAAVAVGVSAQVAVPAGDDQLRSIFSSGLAGTLLNAGTPATIVSVQSASEFGGGFDTFAAGSWIEIKGTGLANNTRVWEGPDFSGVNAPTVLDNVRVTINSRPAFVYYISPTQLNVQAPADAATGPVEVRVTNPGGEQATASVQKRPTVPGMLAPASFKIGGVQYLVAQLPVESGLIPYVGRTNLIPGFVFRPAKPGETVTAYGVGFGDVTPSIAPGVIVGQANAISLPLTISFGPTPATVSYKGLAPNFIGLYQFNFVVPPALAEGDYEIKMTLGGQPLAQAPFFLTVGR